jgi:hypothetical protein
MFFDQSLFLGLSVCVPLCCKVLELRLQHAAVISFCSQQQPESFKMQQNIGSTKTLN